MPNLLIDLDVDRVDLVDEGANSEAHIRLYKRKETGNIMDLKDILAKMKPEHVAVIEDEIAKAKAEVPSATAEELAKAKTALATKEQELADIAKSKTSEENPEDVIKSLDPAVQEVFKSMQRQKEAAEEIARQAAQKSLHDSAVAKAKQLSSLPVEEATLVEVVKGLNDEVFEILKAANAAIDEAGVLDEVGVAKANKDESVVTGSDAWDAIEKAAGVIAEEKKISIEKAIGLAVQQNPDLYRKYLEGGSI